jgi:myo-inositol-1(or 4)-monophosphatase
VVGSTAGVRRAGAAALDLAYVAAGRLDAFWEMNLRPWDIAAGILLVEEAGGLVTELFGGDDVLNTGNILAATPKLHPTLSNMLRESQQREPA